MAKPPESVVAKVRKLMQSPHQRGCLARTGATRSRVPLDEFVALLYECNGSAYALGKKLGIAVAMVAHRRKFIEDELGIELPRGRPEVWKSQAHRHRINLALDDAVVLAFSDVHAWPEVYGVAMAAVVDFNRRLKPAVVILNGDGFDGAQISRHSRIGWDKRPSPAEEIEALSEYLDQVRKANPNARYIRTIGNHCQRLDSYLATNAPLVEDMKGTRLADHLPGWEECMSVYVNDAECIFKHRGRHSGIHATFNEVRRLGTNFVHGHLHRQKAVPWGTPRGRVYGVDLGCTAPVSHPGFDYMEDMTEEWVSGFGIFTFRGGKMLAPDLAEVVDEESGELKFGGKTLRYEL